VVYRLLFDRVLTRTDPERAHELAFRAIRAARPVTSHLPPSPRRRRFPSRAHRGVAVDRRMGIEFPARLGLAAGFDKNARGIDALAALGFGFVEVGTVTALPQPGNPRPRLARLPADRAIVNRMGFNNDGAEVVARRLAARAARSARRSSATPRRDLHDQPRRLGVPRGVPLGVNIGKSRVVPEEDGQAVLADYRASTGLLAPYADYLVVNVSSPNTPGLRNLQAVERLEPLLGAVRARADEVTADRDRPVPLLVKIAPDLDDADVLAVADLAVALGLDGIVATNTTISRDGLASTPAEIAAAGAGGLSGPPLRERADEVVRLLRGRVGPDLTLIGVGGISTPADALARLDAGADLLQAYTAFVYEGPWWPRRINAAIEASTDKEHAR
jgi:dihydroorotate dehydrogenase